MTSRFILILLCCTLFPTGFAVNARAQAFDAPATAVTFGDKNDQLKALMKLQYQIQVLKRLIAHEKAANDIMKSAIDLGDINPAPVPPSQSLCEEVPANIPCAQSFKDLYTGYSVERKKPPEAAKPAAPPAPSLVAGSDVPALEAAALPENVEALPEGTKVYWTDITCLGGTCTAVITPDPTDKKARYRVSVGEKLPDGSVISSISATGVTVKQNKKTVPLEPAPKA